MSDGVRVFLSSHLDPYTKGVREITLAGATVDDLLRVLDGRYPGLRFRIVDEHGRLRQHMNVFVRGDRTRDLATAVAAGDEVHILGSLSGG